MNENVSEKACNSFAHERAIVMNVEDHKYTIRNYWWDTVMWYAINDHQTERFKLALLISNIPLKYSRNFLYYSPLASLPFLSPFFSYVPKISSAPCLSWRITNANRFSIVTKQNKFKFHLNINIAGRKSDNKSLIWKYFHIQFTLNKHRIEIDPFKTINNFRKNQT